MTKRPIIPLYPRISSTGWFCYMKSKRKSIPLTAREAKTIRFYDEMSLQSIGVTPERNFWRYQMDAFQGYLKGGSVLDVGCGAGRDLGELASRGYQCVGIDASYWMLFHAYLNNPYCAVLSMNMYDLEFPEGFFDGFWSSASLHHIQKSRVNLVLNEMRRVTADGGIGFISVREGYGESPGPGDEESRLRYFALYRRDELADRLTSNGFEIIDDGIKNRGDLIKFLYFFVKKV